MARANDPATKRERLLQLLRSRTQADAPWTDEELAAELYTSERTVQRYREWLRDVGYLPPLQNGGEDDTAFDTTELESQSC